MTERLYYCDKLYECEAKVLSCEKCDGGYAVKLNRTVIFPESGGQLSDTGTIDSARILRAEEDGEDVIHICDAPVEMGETVCVKADIEPRLDHTRQHTGEHILSGLISKMFGAVNVGFHMAKDYCTIDIDSVLDKEQLLKLELEANRAVMRNVKITTETVDGSELENISLRKVAKGLEGEVRIVYIGDVDSCTCCGTHCAYSGEVGAIAITDSMKYKQGTRLWFACGERAIKASQSNAETVSKIANRFSTNRDEVFNAVAKQGDELNKTRRELKKRTDMLLEYKAQELENAAEDVNGTKLTVANLEGMAMQELKTLAEKLPSGIKRAAVLFAQNDEALFYLVKTSGAVKQNAREICLVINAMLGGKGGGREELAQGSSSPVNNAEETAAQLSVYLKKSLQ
ncbi:MAG: hypothetical protein IJO48_01455 [Clostridia bacterium]|nr:hypothetical protein [Clostridia bacterium]